MTTGLERRVGRLEQQAAAEPDDPFGLRKMSFDQLSVTLRDICLSILAEPHAVVLSAEARAKIEREIADIEGQIRETAASLARYPAHWDRLRCQWVARCGGVAWSPPVTDHHRQIEGDMWRSVEEVAEEMRWRCDTRARPDIAALIAEG